MPASFPASVSSHLCPVGQICRCLEAALQAVPGQTICCYAQLQLVSKKSHSLDSQSNVDDCKNSIISKFSHHRARSAQPESTQSSDLLHAESCMTHNLCLQGLSDRADSVKSTDRLMGSETPLSLPQPMSLETPPAAPERKGPPSSLSRRFSICHWVCDGHGLESS